MLFKSSLNLVTEKSTTLCLCLLAAGYETNTKSNSSSITNTYKLLTGAEHKGAAAEAFNRILNDPNIYMKKLFSIVEELTTTDKFSNQKESSDDVEMSEQKTEEQNCPSLVLLERKSLSTLIDVFLLGKSSKQIRVTAAHLIKGLWESCENKKEERLKIAKLMFSEVPHLARYGINALEFISLLAYISHKIDWANDENKEFISDVIRNIKIALNASNKLIFSHPNIELYANIHMLTKDSHGSTV
jgi:hypothetical protein